MKVHAQWESGQVSLHISAETDEEDKLLNALMSKPNHEPYVCESPANNWNPRGRASISVYLGKPA